MFFAAKNPVIEQPVQILSKLFPQTATEKSLEEIREEQEKKDEEDRKEKEGSWKRMKLGWVNLNDYDSSFVWNTRFRSM